MDYKCINEQVLCYRPNLIRKRRVGLHCEKFQIYTLLEKYDRIIYMDADTLIHESCPNLFNIVPENHWGCRYEDQSPHHWKGLQELSRLEDSFGSLGEGGHQYFNAGVLVCSKSHKEVFKPQRSMLLSGRWPEQTLLNYRVISGDFPVFELPAENNFLPFDSGWDDVNIRRSASIVHYAGKESKQAMQDDLPWFKSQWEDGHG
jgi:lipopolysaccharide biosynthesis glycosyltransferase